MEQEICLQTFVLTLTTFSLDKEVVSKDIKDPIATELLHEMQLLVSFKMSLCLLLFMYVLYSLCKIAFNYKKRDYLTTTIQILFGLTLLCKCKMLNSIVRGISIGSSLIVEDSSIYTNYTILVVFCYLSDFCFCSAVIVQLFLWY